MKIYDISLTISDETLVWPDDTRISILRNMDMKNGDMYTLSRITATVHAGTHLDAPMHFLREGYGVDRIDPARLIGPCFVADFTGADSIDDIILTHAGIPEETTRLLCKTRNSAYLASSDKIFHTDFTGLTRSGAEWTVKNNITLIGIDYLSVGAYEDIIPVHEILLSNDIIPVESLDLSQITQGEYQLICLPLKLKDCDGAPVRAVLISNK